jgi:TPP-dependent pyruvate/acetoin dehydrogenase alpha subunit
MMAKSTTRTPPARKRSAAPAKSIDLPKAGALDLLRQMWEIRLFEERVYDLLGKNQIKGASHLYAGEEAVAVGAVSVLRDDDWITSAHRGHGHCHARGASMAKSEGERVDHYNKMMAELCGRATGYCLGRGGSMHIADVQKGNLGATGIVGGNIPVATGAGLAQKLMKKDSVVLCFFGDGASNTGNFHETLNMAALWKLPVVYIVENNLYGMSVPLEKATAKLEIADRGCAYGIPGEVVDGMDVIAVRRAVAKAVDRARKGQGPSLVECKTYRWYGHSRSDPRAYRTKEEEAAWKARDPLPAFVRQLLKEKVATQAEVAAVETAARKAIDVATDFAFASPLPAVEELEHHVYAPFHWTSRDVEREAELRARVRSGGPGTRKIRYWQAIQEALREEMIRDPKVFLLGEDIGIYGGAYGATRGLIEEFGESSATPLSPRRRSAARPWARRWPACGRWLRSCMLTSRRWRWIRSPTRAPRTATCSAARRRCRWSCAPSERRPQHRRPSFAVARSAVDALPRHLRRHAGHALRRQRAAQGRHSRRQSGDVHRTQDALRHRGPGAGRGLHHPLWRGRREARGQGCDADHLFAHGPPRPGGRREAGARGHQR